MDRQRLHDNLFDERVEPGGGLWTDHAARYEFAESLIPAASLVLDAGSGTAYGAEILGSSHVVAADGSLTALRVAADHCGPHVRPVATDLLRLPFPDRRFDAVTCMEVIEHVTSPQLLAIELARVLRPGGIALISTPNARIELAYERSKGRDRWEHHISPLTSSALRRILSPHFSRVSVLGQTAPAAKLKLAVKAADAFGLRFHLSRAGRGIRSRGPAPATASSPAQFVFSSALRFGANQLLAVAHR